MEQWDIVWRWLQNQGLTILLILIGTIAAYFLWKYTVRLIASRVQALDDEEGSDLDKRTATISRVLKSSGVIVILGTSLLMILTELGIPIAPMLAGVGVFSLAAGMGAKTLVQDVISGLFVLIENQYTIDDVVDIGGARGVVEKMTLRVTVIRDVAGTVHIIPNGEIRQVSNLTPDWSRAIVDVGITYDDDVDKAIRVLQEIGAMAAEDEAVKGMLLEPAVVTGVEGLDDWAVRLRLMVKTKPGEQWNVQRWLRRQIRLVFAEEGVELAFPRQDVKIVQ
ncbi:MAG: mechanosensitive ion channel family protein [Chloroflexi bacterium]|nr:mechanosensitive ion channel family protein [Chloroflexota bacterium]